MGLDIRAVKLGKFHVDPRMSEVEDLIHVFESDDFPGRLGGVEVGYYDHLESEWFYGRAYGAYNRWRNLLAQLAGYPVLQLAERTGADVGAWNAQGGPFWELINFSDCEGFIGGTVAEKIAKDFAKYEAMVSDFEQQDVSDRIGFADGYRKIKAAFDFAVAHSGVVKFS